MPLNPFKLKHARKIIEDAGVGVGDLVTISWQSESAGGDVHKGSHTGVITEIDDWIRISESNQSPGYLHLPLTGLLHVDLTVPSDGDGKVVG